MGNVVFRRYKNNIIHSVSFSINGLVTESIPMPTEQEEALWSQRANRKEQ